MIMTESTDTQWRDAVITALRKINAHKAADEASDMPTLAVSYLCMAHEDRETARCGMSHSTGGVES
jgi:hypothetical protein